jgi:hypothetical protein
MFSAGFAFCYFAVDIGLWAVVLGISVCGAIGYSMIYTTTLSATLKVRIGTNNNSRFHF